MRSESIAAAAALEPDPDDQDWLRESWRDPREFLATLQAWIAERTRTAFKSVPGDGHALYHDCVERHIDAGLTALRWYDHRPGADHGWHALSFDELHVRCALRAASWTDHGVKPGAVVCVMLPFGVEAVVSVLAGLRLGACISLLEPWGPEYITHRLLALAPQHIATEPFYVPLLADQAALALPSDGLGTRSGGYSHTYAPGELCALLLSPLRRPRPGAVPLSGDDALLGALRDGALTFALRPGDALAAPGFCGPQHQPALLLATLGAGATFVHVPAEDALRDPSLLDAHPLRSVGITSAMADVLLSPGRSTRHRWDHVFRNPEDPTDWEAWRDLVQTHDLERTAMSNVVIEAASGGALLCSPRRTGTQHLLHLMSVRPAAGRPWTLLDFSRTGQRSVGDVGVFAPMAGEPGKEAPVEPMYIALGRRRGGEYLYGGAVEPRRSGRVYPTPEVLAALADCPFLDGASVVAVAAGGPTLAQRFVLLAFVGAESDERFAALEPARKAELMRMLASRLHESMLPDHIELFPLHPRRQDGAIDHDWCQTQYTSGTLFHKARAPVFQRMAALRQQTR